MLRSLIHSKHKMISNGSNAALKNLLNYRPGNINHTPLDSVTKAMNLKELPSLSIRKQRALEQELDRKLSDTCEIIDMTMSPKKGENGDHGSGGFMRGKSEEEDEEDDDHEVEEEVSEGVDSGEKAKLKEGNEGDEQKGNVLEDESPVSMNVVPPQSMGERPQQETEFDQITDYSLRYEQEEEEDEEASDQFNGNEIILILEDTVKCYEEEGTPYTISNATSMTDLRRESSERRGKMMTGNQEGQKVGGGPQQQKKMVLQKADGNSGIQTPERPFKYAEEGTPGCFSTEFSRIGSMSSLEGGDDQQRPPEVTEEQPKGKPLNDGDQKAPEEDSQVNEPKENATPNVETVSEEGSPSSTKEEPSRTPPLPQCPPPATNRPSNVTKASPAGATSKSVSFIDYAQETPLMFSRTSSLESLSSAEPACVDDVSSVVSEFSRVASGIVSPSELPDSPTQSVPQSPKERRRRMMMGQNANASGPEMMMMPKGGARQQPLGGGGGGANQHSVFEDKLDTFNVENTPAQFSCATSLSNLSFLNDDQGGVDTKEQVQEGSVADMNKKVNEEPKAQIKAPDEGSQAQTQPVEKSSDSDEADEEGDDELRDTCVSMGLNKRAKGDLNPDLMRHYYTEDTPAHLSKACSNSDLSVLSMLDNANQCEVVHDDSSSDEAGGGNPEEDEKLLEECINNGIEKSISKAAASESAAPPPALPMKPKAMSAVANEQKPRRDSLSSLSIDSGDDGDILEQAIAAGMNRVARRPEFVIGESSQSVVTVVGRGVSAANVSMSSLDSCESNEQSNLLLEQCIQSGLEKRSGSAAGSTSTLTAQPVSQPPLRTQKPRVGGMGSKVSSSQRSKVVPVRHVEYHKTDDEALLMECINMGIEKNVSKGSSRPQQHQSQGPAAPSQGSRYEYRENINSENILARQNQDILRRIERMTLEEKFGRSSEPKNVNGASVDTPESCAGAALGTLPTSNTTVPAGRVLVVQEAEVGQEAIQASEHRQPQRRTTGDGEEGVDTRSSTSNRVPQNCLVASTDAPRNGQMSQEEEEECTTPTEMLAEVAVLPQEGVINSINGFDDGREALEKSNESPALKSQSATEQSFLFTDKSECEKSENGAGVTSQMLMMDVSNEYMVDSVNRREVLSTSSGGAVVEKHKDPDLMLKSVDRLTHVLVTTAEYLRAHEVSAASELEAAAKKRMEGSCEEGTWNEDTCPNGDVSFPSLSFSPPKIELEGGGHQPEREEDEDENTITASLSLNKITEPAAAAIAVIGSDVEMRGSVTTEAANGDATNSPAVAQQQQNSKLSCSKQVRILAFKMELRQVAVLIGY